MSFTETKLKKVLADESWNISVLGKNLKNSRSLVQLRGTKIGGLVEGDDVFGYLVPNSGLRNQLTIKIPRNGQNGNSGEILIYYRDSKNLKSASFLLEITNHGANATYDGKCLVSFREILHNDKGEHNLEGLNR